MATQQTETIAKWLCSRDTGMSSMAMARRLLGATVDTPLYSHPLDADDLGRCIRFIGLFKRHRACPEFMRGCSENWDALVDHWSELERLYFAGVASGDYALCDMKMFALLEEVQNGS